MLQGNKRRKPSGKIAKYCKTVKPSGLKEGLSAAVLEKITRTLGKAVDKSELNKCFKIVFGDMVIFSENYAKVQKIMFIVHYCYQSQE